MHTDTHFIALFELDTGVSVFVVAEEVVPHGSGRFPQKSPSLRFRIHHFCQHKGRVAAQCSGHKTRSLSDPSIFTPRFRLFPGRFSPFSMAEERKFEPLDEELVTPSRQVAVVAEHQPLPPLTSPGAADTRAIHKALRPEASLRGSSSAGDLQAFVLDSGMVCSGFFLGLCVCL